MWYFPSESPFIASTVVDVRQVNRLVQGWANEVNGNLNEHNFVDDFGANAVANDMAEADVAARLFSKKKKIDPHAATATMFKIPHSTRWSPVDDSGGTFVSRGGQCLVFISFQLHCPTVPSNQSGTNYCIELDGVPMMDTLLGTGDQSNDFLDTAFGATVSGGQVEFDYGTSPSFRAEQEKHRVTGLFNLTPGEHTIRLLVRNLFTITATPPQYISQREAIFLDLWA